MNLLYYPKFWQKKFSVIALLLLPFSVIYTILGYLRYYLNIERKLPGKVISIGNIAAGGTGKTQLTIFLAKEFTNKGINFVIISKGYGGYYDSPMVVTKDMDALYVGDEALELCEYGTTIVARKVIDAIELLHHLKPEVIIVDDGIQNSSFYKDYRVVTLDSNRWFGNFLPIPSGPVRMPYIMNKVDSVIIVGQRSKNKRPKFKQDTYYASIEPIEKIDIENSYYYAFAGIGDPDRFFESLRLQGLDLVATRTFPNHYQYSLSDILKLRDFAFTYGLTLITTPKDYVKLDKNYKDDVICYKVQLSVADKERFLNSIYEKLSLNY